MPNSTTPKSPSQPQPCETVEEGTTRAIYAHRLLAIALTLAFAGIIARVAILQTDPAPQLKRFIGAQYSNAPLFAPRGPILDNKGRTLANTGVAQRLFVDPKMIEDPGTFPERVGHGLNIDPAEIGQKLHKRPNSRYIVLHKRLSEEQLNKLESINVKGLYTDLWLERQYPMGPVAGQIIGFVGQEGIGFEGAERLYNAELKGTSGKLHYLRDSGLRPMHVDRNKFTAPKDGKTIRLSIDIAIQRMAEQQLAETCEKFKVETAEMVVMNPHTGEIVAMANHPPFDPNEFRTTDPKYRLNRCVTDPFEPGSTFKPFIWAMGVEGKYARSEEMINTNQSLGRALRDTHGHGTITWANVLIKSSNRGMAAVGLRMGNTKLYQAVRAFGFGELTGSGLSGESRGMVNPLRKWNKRFSPTSIPMGQEIAVTPLQLCRATCVFANGGLLVSPTIRKGNPSDPTDPTNTQLVRRVLSEKTAFITRSVMRRVMTEGTGRRSQSKLYDIFGKTGTAQVARNDGRGYEADAYSSVFVGGAPYDNPQLVVACVVHRTKRKTGYYGGLVAGPAVKEVLEQSLRYMGVPAKDETRTASVR
jgi:cell division protein FtsI (penicillin-binding protein 3)